MNGRYCHECGTPLATDARFCATCGAGVAPGGRDVPGFESVDARPAAAPAADFNALVHSPAVIAGLVAVGAALVFAFYVVVLSGGENEARIAASGVSVAVPSGWQSAAGQSRLILGVPSAVSLDWDNAAVSAPRVRIQRLGPAEPVSDFVSAYASAETRAEARSMRIIETATRVKVAGRTAVSLTYSVKRGEREVITRHTTAKLGSDVLVIVAEAPADSWQTARPTFERLLAGITVSR